MKRIQGISISLLLAFPLLYSCDQNATETPAPECRIAPVPGPCEAAIYRYYFNTQTNECDSFLWGGCDGVVPFQTMESCECDCEQQ